MNNQKCGAQCRYAMNARTMNLWQFVEAKWFLIFKYLLTWLTKKYSSFVDSVALHIVGNIASAIFMWLSSDILYF